MKKNNITTTNDSQLLMIKEKQTWVTKIVMTNKTKMTNGETKIRNQMKKQECRSRKERKKERKKESKLTSKRKSLTKIHVKGNH